ncbi:endonuclease V [Idiomarina xiamenensis]|uniref:Deoxyribonuclease V n=1 Tax=Idiomarina xiamenensis 10-D-4 TaxID=740709 RepID=K2JVZ5_9GAMM|nr:endonuclease V [Idiomarina xiamenensis]EKE87571.1 deoxyribonuclease V [Idiomarina xiamenensis 10-D-4]
MQDHQHNSIAAPSIDWPGSVAAARQQQRQLAQRCLQQTTEWSGLCHGDVVVGADVAFPQNGQLTRAAVVAMRWPCLTVLELQVHEQATSLPYIPGCLSYREGPALLAALAKLNHDYRLLMCDGQGQSHPQRLGIAAHIGAVLQKPSIGIAKSRLCGNGSEPAAARGSSSEHWHDDKQQQLAGYWLRSREGVKAVLVSAGYGLDQQQALTAVKQCLGRYKLPLPTHLADKLSKSY